MRYAFLSEQSVVVQVIVGELSEQQQQQILNDYFVLFGAVVIVPIPDGVPLWIGGVYDSEQGFLPPIQPEPEPAPEPQPEPLPEPQPEPEI